jgi:hypothetical protein
VESEVVREDCVGPENVDTSEGGREKGIAAGEDGSAGSGEVMGLIIVGV